MPYVLIFFATLSAVVSGGLFTFAMLQPTPTDLSQPSPKPVQFMLAGFLFLNAAALLVASYQLP